MTERQEPMGGTPPLGQARYEASTTYVATSVGDRVRWPAIVAGVFVALSTWVILSLLGLAIGLSAADEPGRLGIGAGIWSAVSAIIGFFLGGWVAARTSAVRGPNTGLINGSMVWAVAIPLLLFFFAGGFASMVGPAMLGDRAQPAAERTVPRAPADQVTDRPIIRTETAAGAAWATLIPLLLSLGAAALGGYVGTRSTGLRSGLTGTTTGTT